ncbi:bifunctional 3-(3-hydroxy-phenyl)propionate/3-hydroxycinnamic acid hydroxylase [Kutzneria buriramensis]|uniref:3-(3-hydroxy-phenyl)propionate hydroxylase n=1 Tax=Kutzneria buriramensis TaxID=1045776 RepID=A0A3E0HII8_9PSEU|nr:3-(3-hydroxy-phenyl)propionate hydroxylase [Kutzneria buriramensis]
MKVPVVIVGAGPTGLTAAALLGRRGVECLVLERWESVYPQPRAVHLDDEICRILGRLGLAGEFAAMSWPCHGLRLLDPDLRVLAEFHRSPGAGCHGYPEANMFDQPDLEHLLRAHLEAVGAVTLRGSTEVTGIRQDRTGVRVEVTDRGTGARETIHADYVLGCDGANSLVRSAIGATMADLKFEQRWLVVDVATTADLGQWEGVHQVCDPARAATYMRIGKTRYRWEFRLLPGEAADDFGDLDRLHPLITPWTRDIPPGDLEIVRVAEYTFRARIADRWRDRRVFLLGDAAHLTPPFIGQGMGAGLRDAANLAWKLAGVLDGNLPANALDTYEAERKPHARAMIRRAVLIGKAMTEGGRFGDLIRRVVAPRLNGRALDSATPALHRSALVTRPRFRRSLAGRLCPNVLLDAGTRFDDEVGGRFAVVTADIPSDRERAIIEERGAVLVTTRQSGELHRWLRAGAAIVRPDGTVLSTSNSLSQILPRFTADLR